MRNIFIKSFVIIVFFLLFFSANVQAIDNTDTKIDKGIETKVNELYDYLTNVKSEYEITNSMDIRSYVKSFMKTGKGNLSYKYLIEAILKYSIKEVTSSVKVLLMVVIISIICALITNLQNAFSNEGLTNIAFFSCYSVLIIIIGKSFFIGVNLVTSTINKTGDFMAALVPVLLLLLSSVGGFGEAAVMDPIIIGVINVNTRIFIDFVIPVILIGFVLQFVNCISTEFKIEKLTSLFNQIALWSQGIVMTIFIGIITIRGITASTVDEVAAKTAKYAVDNFIPVVGGCLSDAISTVAGYSLLLKNAISSVGLIILVVIVIFPILKLFIIAMLYKLTAALIQPISDERIVSCINSAGDSLILINSCLVSTSVMFFILISIVAAAGKMVMG